jgi:hypothetical protein
MEKLHVNNGNGQSYGFVLYRRAALAVRANSTLRIQSGAFRDMGVVLLDGERKTEKLTSASQLLQFGYWETK